MKQTAVEWLIEQILDYPLEDSTNVAHLKKHVNKVTVFEQAKEMEKIDKHSEYMRGWRDGYSKGYSEEEVRLAYFQGEKDSYVKGGQTKEMEDEFIESLKNKLNKSE